MTREPSEAGAGGPGWLRPTGRARPPVMSLLCAELHTWRWAMEWTDSVWELCVGVLADLLIIVFNRIIDLLGYVLTYMDLSLHGITASFLQTW
eukprot:SAG22_NODE_13_length_33548_cov_57.167773_21_plen_93_part_00